VNDTNAKTVPALGFRLFVVLPILAISLLWAFWPALREMSQRWAHDTRYSHGYLVPAFAAMLLWVRRATLFAAPAKPTWWGIVFIAAGALMQLCGARFYITWIAAVSIIPSLAGLALLLGGWQALRWAGPSIAFLFFMIPLPYRLELALGYPLQRIATLSSTYVLQTLGLPAVSEGNIILLNDFQIGVVEACNGLGMLFMFLAFAVGVALLIRNSWVDKILIVLSAVPIAVAANVLRITATGLLHELAGPRIADVVYHDLAGWLMMPIAVGALWAELFLLSRLFIETNAERPVPIGLMTMTATTTRRGHQAGRAGGSPGSGSGSIPGRP
jgi:exosortase